MTEYNDKQAVRISEENYRAVFDVINDAVFIHKPDNGEILDCNQKTLQLYGYSLEDIRLKTIGDLSSGKPPYDHNNALKFVQTAAGDGPQIFEWLAKDKAGKEFWVEVNLKKILVGSEVRVLAIVRDIQLLKSASEELKELQKRIEFILGVTKTGVDIIDSDFNIVYIDPTWAKVYGDFKGKKCFEYFTGRSSSCPGCTLKLAFLTKQPVVTEEVLPREGNRPIQVTTIPFQNEKGEWLVAEINVDITKIKRTQELLKEQKSSLQSIADNVPGAVYEYQLTKDGKQSFIFLSAGAKELFGLGLTEMKKDFSLAWGLIIPDDAELVQESILSSARSMQQWNMEFRIKMPNGENKWIHGSSMPKLNAKDGSIVWTGTFLDITARKKVEDELSRKLRELEIFQKAAIGRELKMIELKKKIEKLEEELKKQQ
ncbi:MAG: PAS domain S-box protein [Candidatus Omnitrophica bacterium]|nr:PAS domain S-box protein [Candidatus Omnitrophota bacterium]